MADTPGIISNTIVVNATQAKQEFESLSRQLSQLKTAYEKAFRSDSKTTIFKEESLSTDELNRRIGSLTSEIQRLKTAMNAGTANDTFIDSQTKALEKEALAAQMATEKVRRLNEEFRASQVSSQSKANAEWASMKASYKPDRSVVNPENVAQLKEQFMLRQRINEATERTNVKAIADAEKLAQTQAKANSAALKSQMQGMDFTTYTQQLRGMNTEAQKFYQTWQRTGLEADKVRFMDKRNEFMQLNTQADAFNKHMQVAGDKVGYLGSLSQKLRSHFNWILAGSILAAFAVIPNAVEDITRETELLGTKLKQNLELAEKYKGNQEGLDNDIKHLGDVAATFAVGYGANVKDVMEMMQVLSRRFKSPEELTYYTNLAMVMHKLDFVEPKKAAEDLEAVILSMGLDFHGAKQFIDEFSVAVHTARITGTELLSAIQRSGATFHNMNFNTAEAIAMISTLSTVTAKAGANIGASLNSVLINVDFKKAAQALKAYNLEVYEVVDGHTKMRDGAQIWREIAQVFNGLDDNKANEFANAMSGGKFRANDLRALLSNWQQFETILEDINTKASPELTASLLKTGMETYDTSVKRMNASLQVFGITLGKEVLPALKSMTDGLSEGIQWLNDHREAVNKGVDALGKIVEALVTYKAYQLLATAATKEGSVALSFMTSLQGGFTVAFANMGSAVLTFASTIGMAAIRLAAFYAIAEAVMRLGSARSQDSREKEFMSTVNERGTQTPEETAAYNAILARDEYKKKNAWASGDNAITGQWAMYGSGSIFGIGGGSQDEADRLNRIADEKVKAAESNSAMNKVNKMVAEAENMMPQTAPKIEYPSVAGQDLGTPKKVKDTSNGGVPPSDPAMKIQRDAYKMAQNAMFLESKVSADNYANSLSNLATKEALYGTTVRNTIDGYTVKTKRISDLAEEERKYNNESEYLNGLLDDKISAEGELQESLGITKEAWDGLSKAEKASLRLNNRDILEQHQLTKAQVSAMQGYKEKASEVHKEIVKITDELLKARYAGSFDFMKLSERNVKTATSIEDTNIAKINPRNPMGAFDKVEIQHKAEMQRNIEYTKQAKFLKEELAALNDEEVKVAQKAIDTANAMDEGEEKTKALAEATLYLKAAQEGNTAGQRSLSDAINENAKTIEVSNAKLEETKDKYKAIKDAWASTFADMITEGKSGSEILKSLWKDLANEAIQRLLGVNKQGSLLASTAGKSKGAASTTGKKGIGKHASGGVFNVPHIAQVAEDGDEAIVNLKRLRNGDQRQAGILDYANSQVYKGESYVPTLKNPELAQTGTQNIQIQQSSEHIAELSKQTKVLQDMMMLMLKNQGGQGGGTTVIASTVTDSQVLGALSRNPRAVQGITAKNKGNGY